MELHTALALFKRFWWLLLAGTLVGIAIAGARAFQPAEHTYTATARSQINGLEFGVDLSTEIDHRVNGAIALGLSDIQAREILSEVGFDPGEPGETDDLVEFHRAVKVTSRGGATIQVEVTMPSPELAAQVADLVLDVFEPRMLAALPNQTGARIGERVHQLGVSVVAQRSWSASVMLGAAGGLLVAAGVVAIRYFRRRTVLSVPEAEKVAGLPVVAEIRLPERPKQAHEVQPDQMSLLATKITLMGGATPRLVVWGSVSEEQVSGAISLAQAYADLLHPGGEVWKALGVVGAELDGTGQDDVNMQARMALAGSDPSALTTTAVRQVVDGPLAELGQVVAVTDLGTPLGLAIMTAADASLIVVSLGHTLVNDLMSAVVDLKQMGITPTGIVVLVQGSAR